MKHIPYLQRPALMALMSTCLSTTAILHAQEDRGRNDRPSGDIENSDPFRKKTVELGVKLLDDQNPALLAEQARIFFERGEMEKAVAVQAEASEQAQAAAARLQETLSRYQTEQAKQPDAESLNLEAWEVVAPGTDRAGKAELEIAQKKAEQANKLTGYKDAAFLDTLARVHFVRGNVAKALELQSKAVAIANKEDHHQKVEMSGSLAEYKARAAMQGGKGPFAESPESDAPLNPASHEWAQAVRDLGNNAGLLNYIAWAMVRSDYYLADVEIDFALNAAQRANQLTSGKNPDILDTLARAHFRRGDIDEAIKLQTKAVGIAPEDRKESFAATLSEYEKKAANPFEEERTDEKAANPFGAEQTDKPFEN